MSLTVPTLHKLRFPSWTRTRTRPGHVSAGLGRGPLRAEWLVLVESPRLRPFSCHCPLPPLLLDPPAYPTMSHLRCCGSFRCSGRKCLTARGLAAWLDADSPLCGRLPPRHRPAPPRCLWPGWTELDSTGGRRKASLRTCSAALGSPPWRCGQAVDTAHPSIAITKASFNHCVDHERVHQALFSPLGTHFA